MDNPTIFYSASANGFYTPGVNSSIPGDAVEIDYERWLFLLDGQGRGGRISVGDDGFPVVSIPPETLDTRKAEAIRNINTEYENRIQAISSGYPGAERESWPVQTSEAHALLADESSVTPWIDSAAEARGISRSELAQRIVSLDAQFRVLHGGLSGTRQRLEQEIIESTTAAEVASIVWP